MVMGLFMKGKVNFPLESQGWNQDHRVGLTGSKFQLIIRSHLDFVGGEEASLRGQTEAVERTLKFGYADWLVSWLGML